MLRAGLCLALAAATPTRAAELESAASISDFAVRSWGRAGLPGDSITTILQTRDGYLYIGTSSRLVRFDGARFTEIPLATALGAPATNGPARIGALCEDSDGQLWVGTQQDGLFCLGAGGLRHWRQRSGLLDDSVTSLAADAGGGVWIGTQAGLNRWDGKSFAAFTSRDGLTDVSVTGVHVARSGAVWITTRSGMFQFKDAPPSPGDAGAGRILPYEFETESQGRRPEFLGAYEDRQGNLWVYGDTYLINLAEGARFNHWRGVDAAAMRIWSLCEGRDGRLWIGTSGRGLFYFGDNKFQPVPVSELHWPNDVRAICEDREGSLWLGTSSGGLLQLLPQPVQVMRAEQGLPSGPATCLATDAARRIYAGFEAGGLFAGETAPGTGPAFRFGAANRFDAYPANDGLEGQSLVVSLCTTPNGALWIGTLSDGLYCVLNGRKLQLTTLNGLADNCILTLCTTPDGSVWAGTRSGALHRLDSGSGNWGLGTGVLGLGSRVSDFGSAPAPSSQTPDARPQSAITTLTTTHGLPGTAITALLPASSASASSGALWIGTQDGQVLHYEPSSPSEQDWKVVRMHQLSIASGGAAARSAAILALHEDAQGRLWIGTADAGLACWTGQSFHSWNSESGLPDDSVWGLVDDAGGHLWLLSGRGLFRVSREAAAVALADSAPLRGHLMFESHKTAPSLRFGGPRALRSAEDELWFATADGLIAVDKSIREITPTLPLPVRLENVLVNGKPISGVGDGVWGLGGNPRPESGVRSPESRVPRPQTPDPRPHPPSPVRLPTDLETLEFEFTALSFVAPEKLLFRYQLEGLERDWVAGGSERRVRYGPLPYGNYRFRVAASVGDGMWFEAPEAFAFTVPTPLWRTPGAIALYVLGAVALVAGIVRMVSLRRFRLHLARLEQQRVVERERMRIAQDMHDDIGSKLTKISFLSERARISLESRVPGPESSDARPQTPDPRPEVAGQIESIANTSRELLQTLDEIVWAVNPRNDSLEHLAAYLSHYAAEYFQNTAVPCELRLPRDLPHHPLSAELRHNLFLAFEEALNNALKHSGATNVNVEMKAVGATFVIKVRDNGRGFDVAAAQRERPATQGRRGGNGLVNMRQRLALVGGECLVESEPGQGTEVCLRIPLTSPARVKV